MYQWMSECTSSIGMYLLLNTSYSHQQDFAGIWSGDNVELIGDTNNTEFMQNYTDITETVFEEMEENMDSEFAKSILSDYNTSD